jgi:hypothetical protein
VDFKKSLCIVCFETETIVFYQKKKKQKNKKQKKQGCVPAGILRHAWHKEQCASGAN